jgi:hypothetical protein
MSSSILCEIKASPSCMCYTFLAYLNAWSFLFSWRRKCHGLLHITIWSRGLLQSIHIQMQMCLIYPQDLPGVLAETLKQLNSWHGQTLKSKLQASFLSKAMALVSVVIFSYYTIQTVQLKFWRVVLNHCLYQYQYLIIGI